MHAHHDIVAMHGMLITPVCMHSMIRHAMRVFLLLPKASSIHALPADGIRQTVKFSSFGTCMAFMSPGGARYSPTWHASPPPPMRPHLPPQEEPVNPSSLIQMNIHTRKHVTGQCPPTLM